MPSLPHLHVFCADIIPFLGGKIAVLALGLPSWLGFCPLSNSKNKKSSISEVPGEIPGPVLIGTDYVPLSSPITKILISLTLASPIHPLLHSVQFSSVAQSCPTLSNPMDCSMPGFSVYHQLPEPAQTHVRRVSDAIQPSRPLLSPSSATFILSQNQGLFQ